MTQYTTLTDLATAATAALGLSVQTSPEGVFCSNQIVGVDLARLQIDWAGEPDAGPELWLWLLSQGFHTQNRSSTDRFGNNFHLTELPSGTSSCGPTADASGHYPASEEAGRSADAYVAPGEWVMEFQRRNRRNATPGTDAAIERAIRAHRRGDVLPPEPPADAPTWGPEHPDFPADVAMVATRLEGMGARRRS